MSLIALSSLVVEPTHTLDLVRDPDDDRMLEAALAGLADVIVTGDADVLHLEAIDGVRILTAANFLAELRQ